MNAWEAAELWPPGEWARRAKVLQDKFNLRPVERLTKQEEKLFRRAVRRMREQYRAEFLQRKHDEVLGQKSQ